MSGVALRPYQQEAITAVEQALERGVRRPLIALPTGSGKTVVVASLIAKRGGSALVLAHRDELLRQAAAKIAVAIRRSRSGSGSSPRERDDVAAPVVVGSVQTLAQTRPARAAAATVRHRCCRRGSSRERAVVPQDPRAPGALAADPRGDRHPAALRRQAARRGVGGDRLPARDRRDDPRRLPDRRARHPRRP